MKCFKHQMVIRSYKYNFLILVFSPSVSLPHPFQWFPAWKYPERSDPGSLPVLSGRLFAEGSFRLYNRNIHIAIRVIQILSPRASFIVSVNITSSSHITIFNISFHSLYLTFCFWKKFNKFCLAWQTECHILHGLRHIFSIFALILCFSHFINIILCTHKNLPVSANTKLYCKKQRDFFTDNFRINPRFFLKIFGTSVSFSVCFSFWQFREVHGFWHSWCRIPVEGR